jgi:hypothetical protein
MEFNRATPKYFLLYAPTRLKCRISAESLM